MGNGRRFQYLHGKIRQFRWASVWEKIAIFAELQESFHRDHIQPVVPDEYLRAARQNAL